MGLFDFFKNSKSKTQAKAKSKATAGDQNQSQSHPVKEDKIKERENALISSATTTSIDSNLDTAEESHAMLSSCSENKDVDDEEVNASIQNYEVIRELGRGATAVVQLGRRKSSIQDEEQERELVALKVYKTSLLKRMRDIKRVGRRMVVSTGLDKVQKEIAIMKKLSHPHLLNLCEVFDDDADTLVLMLEYAPYGQVMDWNPKVRSYQPNTKLLKHVGSVCFAEEEQQRFVRELLLGLEYLHVNSICHRDLKPENILLSSDGSCKIADFGVAHLFEDEAGTGEESASDNNQTAENKKKGMVTTTAGTYAFMAPETLAGGAFDAYIADVWALGITFYAIVFGCIPFYDPDVVKLFDKIQEQDLTIPEDSAVSDSLKDLITRLLDKNPQTRMTIAEAKQHPWVLDGMTNEEKNAFLTSCGEQVQVNDQDIARAVTKVASLNVMVRVKLGANKWKRKAFAARDRRLEKEAAQSQSRELEDKAPAQELPNDEARSSNQVDA